MFCVKCGVELADSEKTCPLCGTSVYHPTLKQATVAASYPPRERPRESMKPQGVLFVVTVLFLIPLVLVLLTDLSINGRMVWSGYVVGALVMTYVMLVLPFWFRHPNPVIFVPVSFAAIGLYLLYIDLFTGGGWFLPFALPVTGGALLIVTAVVTLTRYLRRGYLYIFGGAFIAGGAFIVLVEFLLNLTFWVGRPVFWSVYPLTVGVLLGLMLIVIAICRPLRESLRKKFFI